ncbi:acyl-CoA N-acyltransferase [Dipodascopsis uninucleata]
MSEHIPMFSEQEFICPKSASSIAPAYKLRALRASDHALGFLDVLSDLTTVGEIDMKTFTERVNYMSERPLEYFVLVIENVESGKIVGTGTLLVERKFIHACGLVGHIEDIAIAKTEQGKHLGITIINALDFIGKKVGCYKNILDCSPKNEPFYIKCGYSNSGYEMTKRFH